MTNDLKLMDGPFGRVQEEGAFLPPYEYPFYRYLVSEGMGRVFPGVLFQKGSQMFEPPEDTDGNRVR